MNTECADFTLVKRGMQIAFDAGSPSPRDVECKQFTQHMSHSCPVIACKSIMDELASKWAAFCI